MQRKIRNLLCFSGWEKVLYGGSATLLLAAFDFEVLAFFAAVATLFFLAAYRNPLRNSPDISDFGVIAPVDGRVVSIEEIEDGKYGYRLLVDSSVVHSAPLRAPFQAERISLRLRHGSRLPRSSRLFMTLNESLEARFESGKRAVKVLHTLKRSPLSIEVSKLGDGVECCEVYGFAYNALTEIYLPKMFRLNVTNGQLLLASQNIIGYFGIEER